MRACPSGYAGHRGPRIGRKSGPHGPFQARNVPDRDPAALPLPEGLRGAAAKVVGAMIAKGFLQQIATEWLWTYKSERPNMGIGGVTPAMKLTMAA
jgi:hypothetical protein